MQSSVEWLSARLTPGPRRSRWDHGLLSSTSLDNDQQPIQLLYMQSTSE